RVGTGSSDIGVNLIHSQYEAYRFSHHSESDDAARFEPPLRFSSGASGRSSARSSWPAINAAIVDFFFRDGFSGWWVGPGLERWNGDVTEKASGVRHGYETDILTVGGGYVWKFSKHVYLNPWAGVHIPIAGDREVSFPSAVFKINVTPEASVKLGIAF